MSRSKKPIIEYRYYNLPFSFPLLLLHGDRWRISSKKSGRLHFHNCLEIGLCHSDSGIMEFEEVAVPFKAGDISCVPRYLPHTTYSSPNEASLWSYIFLDPDSLFGTLFHNQNMSLDKLLLNNRNYQLIINKEQYPQAYHLIISIIEEMTTQKPGYQYSVRGLMLSLCIELYRIYSVVAKSSAPVHTPNIVFEKILIISNAIEHIHNNYMNAISIEDLALLCHLSVSHFRRIFHETMGVAPLSYLNCTRIDQACSLLRSTDYSILTIAEMVGFHSISSFNRCFTKLLNMPPNTWRKQAATTYTTSTKASILEYIGWV